MGRVWNNDRNSFSPSYRTTYSNITYAQVASHSSRRRPNIEKTSVLISLWWDCFYGNGWAYSENFGKEKINVIKKYRCRGTSRLKWFRSRWSTFEFDNTLFPTIDSYWSWRSQKQAVGGIKIYKRGDLIFRG